MSGVVAIIEHDRSVGAAVGAVSGDDTLGLTQQLAHGGKVMRAEGGQASVGTNEVSRCVGAHYLAEESVAIFGAFGQDVRGNVARVEDVLAVLHEVPAFRD